MKPIPQFGARNECSPELAIANVTVLGARFHSRKRMPHLIVESGSRCRVWNWRYARVGRTWRTSPGGSHQIMDRGSNAHVRTTERGSQRKRGARRVTEEGDRCRPDDELLRRLPTQDGDRMLTSARRMCRPFVEAVHPPEFVTIAAIVALVPKAEPASRMARDIELAGDGCPSALCRSIDESGSCK
jgi:hypothetical protein